MKDEHRKFKQCIFCITSLTGKNRTREHVLGRAISKQLHDSIHWRAQWATGPGFNEGSSEFKNITSRSVCHGCNNEWMSRDNECILAPLKGMFNEVINYLHQEDQLLLRRLLLKIALIVDVETSNRDLEMSPGELEHYAMKFGVTRLHKPVVVQKSRESFKEGNMIPEIGVWIGHHSQLFGINPWFGTGNFRGPLGFPAKRIIYVINNIAVITELGFKKSKTSKFFELCHTPQSTLHWPIIPSVTYDDVLSQFQQTPRICRYRAAFNSPTERRRLEKHFKRTHTWDLPE